MIKILLVDDKPVVRQGWKMRLALENDLVVVGEAGDGREAIDLAARLAPDVILLDLKMPVMDGLQALRGLGPGRRVIVMTIHDDPQTRQQVLDAGAFAFVGKQEPFGVALAAIRRAYAAPGSKSPA